MAPSNERVKLNVVFRLVWKALKLACWQSLDYLFYCTLQSTLRNECIYTVKNVNEALQAD